MGLTALFVRLGSWSWLAETNYRSALLGEKPSNWSHLLAAVYHRATVRDVPKGPGQGSGAAATICFFSITQSNRRFYFFPLRSTSISLCPKNSNSVGSKLKWLRLHLYSAVHSEFLLRDAKAPL